MEVLEQNLSNQLVDWIRNRYFGKYRGTVVRNDDETAKGRLFVEVPAVWEKPVWAMPCVPYAGKSVGSYIIPEPKSGVWVEFEGGDPSYPIWTGTFWADNELPKNEKGTQATPSLKVIRSQQGLMVTMNDDQQVITVSDEDGSNLVTIEVQQGKITVQGALKVVVEAPQIELVEHATHPVVFGDQLMQYLTQLEQIYNTHTHPAELALGVFPITPAPPVSPIIKTAAVSNLLSTKVKSN